MAKLEPGMDEETASWETTTRRAIAITRARDVMSDMAATMPHGCISYRQPRGYTNSKPRRTSGGGKDLSADNSGEVIRRIRRRSWS